MADHGRTVKIIMQRQLSDADRGGDVVVHHRDDGYSCDWAANMPKQAKQEVLSPVNEIEVREALATYRQQVLIDRRVAAAVAKLEIEDALGQVVSHQRKELRAEVTKLPKLVLDDRRLARHELDRQRADHDRQRASMLAEIAQLRAKNAELELRLDGLTHEARRTTIEGKVIDMPSVRRGG